MSYSSGSNIPVYFYTDLKQLVNAINSGHHINHTDGEGIYFIFELSESCKSAFSELEKDESFMSKVSELYPNLEVWTAYKFKEYVRKILLHRIGVETSVLMGDLTLIPCKHLVDDYLSIPSTTDCASINKVGINVVVGITDNQLLIQGSKWIDSKGRVNECFVNGTKELTPKFKRWLITRENRSWFNWIINNIFKRGKK